MPKQQAITRSAKGLYLQYNPIHKVPEGGLIEADNVQIDQEGVVSKRRGVERYGVTFNPDSIFEFQDTIVGFESDGTASYDYSGDGSEWVPYEGTFSPPDASTKIRAKEAQLNWYFTSSDGIMKSDSISTPPIRAGIPTGLDLESTIVGAGGSWLTVDSQAAYRIVWGRMDANGVLLIGAPSFRRIVTNVKVGAQVESGDVTVVGTEADIKVTAVSHGLSNSDTIEISDTTGEGFQNGTFTVTGISSGDFTYRQDSIPTESGTATSTLNYGKNSDAELEFTIPDEIVVGDFYDIYRSLVTPSATDEPSDSLERVNRVAVSEGDISAGKITITDNVPEDALGIRLYTNAEIEGIGKQNSRPPFARDLEVFRSHMFYLNTRQPHVVEISYNNFAAPGEDATLDNTIVLTQGLTELTYTFSSVEDIEELKFKLVTTNAAFSANIKETMHSFCRVLNRSNSLFYAYYISQADDEPGRVAIEARSLATGEFSVTSDGAGAAFTPTIPETGTDYISENSAFPNRLYRSKIQEFEAVPELNFYEVGDAKKEGLRCLALRDSLIILKDDGVFRLSGESERSFTLKMLDGTQRLRAPESAVVLDNAVWALTDDGVVRISEGGTSIMSRQIEDELLKIISFPDFEKITHAVAYESEQRYLLFTQEYPTDTAPRLAWSYNILTRAWTRWRLPAKDGLVQFSTDKLVLAHSKDEFLVRERKDFASTDFKDERFQIDFTNPTTNTNAETGVKTTSVDVEFSPREIKPGWMFEYSPQNMLAARIESVANINQGFYRLFLSIEIPALVSGSANLIAGIGSRIRWAPEAAGSVGSMKQFSFVQLFLDRPVTQCTFASKSDLSASETRTVVADEGLAGSQVVRVPIPRDNQRCRFLSTAFEHGVAGEDFRIFQVSYTVRPYGERTTLSPR